MIYSMITGDMFTFSIIYVIFLFGFSQAYFFLYKGHENPDETPYGTYMSTWMGLLQMTLGDYDVSMTFLQFISLLNPFSLFRFIWHSNFPDISHTVCPAQRYLLSELGENSFHPFHDFRSDFAAQHVDCYDGWVCHIRAEQTVNKQANCKKPHFSISPPIHLLPSAAAVV